MPSADQRIRRLSESVAGRIAAGEVVDRPASVLKELLENAVDAGASRVVVSVKDAGRTLLRVTDDGTGMSPADCRAAFGRHATSKIRDFEDLGSLRTFGFRGEALYAIAAVSRVTLTSVPEGADTARLVRVEGGKIEGDREAAHAPGTTIEVRDLFFNTPARAAFLRSDASERGHLARAVEESALAHPRVSFTLESEGRVSLRFAAKTGEDAGLVRAAEVFGSKNGRALVPVEAAADGMRLSGCVAPPPASHRTRNLQLFFVNRRPVTSRLLQQALYRAFEPYRDRDRHPIAVLHLEIPSDRLDVNVHPNKREVRFGRGLPVFDTVLRAVSNGLLAARKTPVIGAVPPPEAPAPRVPSSGPAPSRGLVREAVERYRERGSSGPAGRERRPLRTLGRLAGGLWLFECEDSLLLLDSACAAERERAAGYSAEVRAGSVKTHPLVLPLTVSVTPPTARKLFEKPALAETLGLRVEPVGKTRLQVNAVPEVFREDGALETIVAGLLEAAAKGSPKSAIEDSLPCEAGTRVETGESEARARTARLLDSDERRCPHGRAALVSLSPSELGALFDESNEVRSEADLSRPPSA